MEKPRAGSAESWGALHNAKQALLFQLEDFLPGNC